jgi:IS1 family transposase/transposase-like protein
MSYFFEFAMDCPRCGSFEYIKDGFAKGRQRYQCKHCELRYTVTQRSGERPPETRQLAIDMYLEGLGFRAIGRVLKVSHTAVFNWVKKAEKEVSLPVENKPVEVAELDEMHTYVGQKKNYRWIWTAIDRFGKRFIAFVCGDRSTKTGLKLWDKLKHLSVGAFATDCWKSYEEFIPPEQHCQSKAETYTAESYNSRIRHYLARFKRKTKCYSKTDEMIEISLNLLIEKLNKRKTIQN